MKKNKILGTLWNGTGFMGVFLVVGWGELCGGVLAAEAEWGASEVPLAEAGWIRGDVAVTVSGGESMAVEALRVTGREGEARVALDFEPEVEKLTTDGERVGEIRYYEDVVIPVAGVAGTGPVELELEGTGIGEWRWRNGIWLAEEALPAGELVEVEALLEGTEPVWRLRFNRDVVALPPANAFEWVEDGREAGPHWQVEREDARRLILRAVSGNDWLRGGGSLHFRGGGEGSSGQRLQGGRYEVAALAKGNAGEAAAQPMDLGSGGVVTLSLGESPVGSGLLSAATSGTFSATGRDARITFEVELESGDQLSAYIDLMEDSADYRFRVEDANGTELFGGYWGTDHPLQRIEIPAAGTYRVQAYVQNTTTDYDLRIDVGRTLFLEAEDNDTAGSSNPLTFIQTVGGGGFQESAAGALSALESNDGWSGSNDVNGDFYDLGTLSTGNSVDVTYQFPNGSSLSTGDLELALFREGEVVPDAIVSDGSSLSTIVATNDRYFLRVAPNDNLDGTSLRFGGDLDHVVLPGEVLDGLGDFTVEFWARGVPGDTALLSAANGSEDNEFLLWWDDATTLQVFDNGTAYSFTVPLIDAITWRHYAVVRDGSAGTLEVLVDGVSQGQASGIPAVVEVTDLILGQDQDTAGGGFQSWQALVGHLDSLRVWDTVRSEAEIQANWKTPLSGGETGLRALYRFNDGSGTVATDDGPNGWDGTLSGPYFDGDVNAAGFNPASMGIRASYYTTVTIGDSVNPEIVGTSLPGGTDDGYYTSIRLDLSEDLDPETVVDAASYDLRAAGPDGILETADDAVYPVEPQSYVSGTDLRLFLPDGPLQPGSYRLQVTADLEDRAGNPLVPYTHTFDLVPLGNFVIENRDNDSRGTATQLGTQAAAGPDGSFLPVFRVAANNPNWVGRVDLNNDGLPDVVSMNDGARMLGTYLNNGDGSFTAGAEYSYVDNGLDAVVVDLDGDGDDDIAVAGRDDDEVRIFFNNQDGTLTPAAAAIAVGNGPRGIAAGDFNGDGANDLVVANEFGSTLTILLNDGSGSGFTASTWDDGVSDPEQVTVGLFDGDTHPDILFTDDANNRVVFLGGNGDGSFGAPVYTELDPEEGNPNDIVAGDFDGDGLLDIAVAYNSSWSTENGSLLFGNGDGSFGGLQSFFTGSYRTELAVADVNGDGHLDLVAGNNYALRVYIGSGERTDPFIGRTDYGYQDDAYGLVAGDFNADGRIDLVAGDPNADELVLHTGNGLRRPPEDGTAPGFYQAQGRGNLRDRDDADWYRFSVKAGETLQLVAWNEDAAASRAGLNYGIYDPGGNRLEQSNSGYTGGRLQLAPVTASVGGTYFVRVGRQYEYFGEYRFRVSVTPEDYEAERENNYRIANANVLGFRTDAGVRQGRVLGQLMPGDDDGDFYGIGNLASGTEVALRLSNLEDSAIVPKLWLYAEDGTILAEESEGVATLDHVLASDANCYVRVTTANEHLTVWSEYRLEVELTDTQVPQITGDTLPADNSVSDALWIAFSLTFNEDLDAATVNDPGNYELRGAGGDDTFNTGDDFVVPLVGLDYTGGSSHQYLLGWNPLQAGRYQLTVFQDGLQDLFGNGLENDYVRVFTVEELPGYLSESAENDSLLTADPLTGQAPGPASGSYLYRGGVGVPTESPEALAMADFNGDGVADAAVSYLGDDQLRIHAGDGDGGFVEGQNFALSGNVYSMEAVDIDGDGDEDLVLAERGSLQGIRWFLNDGAGTFSEGGSTTGGSDPSTVSAGDLDGVNGMDLVVANYGAGSGDGSLSVFLQQGDGSFQHQLLLGGEGLRPVDAAVADMDGDGVADIMFADRAGNQVGILTGNGDGSFAGPVYEPVAPETLAQLVVGDFDGDGYVDVVVDYDNHDRFSLLLNDGSGQLLEYREFFIGNNRYSHLVATDLNGDGSPDIVRSGDYRLAWRFTDPGSERVFGPPVVLNPGEGDLGGIAVGEVTGDGLADIVVVARDTDQLLVYESAPRYDMPTGGAFSELRENYMRGRDVIGENNADYFVFSGEEGQQVVIAAENDDPQWSSHSIQLLDETDDVLNSYTLSNGYGQFGPVTLPRSGNYFIRVTGNNGHDDEYRLHVSLLDAAIQPESEDNDHYSQADELRFAETPGTREARVYGKAPERSSNDSDWFGLGNLAENATVTVTFEQPADSTLVPELSLRADNGNVTRLAGDPGDSEISYTLTAGEEDYHYVVVDFANAPFRDRYFLDVVLSDEEPPVITDLNLPADGTASSAFYVEAQLSFSEDLQADLVMDAGTYELRHSGADGQFGTADDQIFGITPQSYSSGLTVDLGLDESPLPPGQYEFRIAADALRDLFGNPLPEDYVQSFTIEGIQGYVSESVSNGSLAEADGLSTQPNESHDGSFAWQGTLSRSTEDEPRDVVLVDLDGDGQLDAVVASGRSTLGLDKYTNDGAGGWEAPEVLRSGGYPDRIEDLLTGDFDGDGYGDVAMAVRTLNNSSGSRVEVLLGDGAGGLVDWYTETAINQPRAMVQADLNDDGWPDLLVLEDNGTPPALSVLINNGDGSGFTRSAFTDWVAGADPVALAAGDFDGDGDVDIAVVEDNDGTLMLLENDGTGLLSRVTEEALVATDPVELGSGDFDGDGLDDLVVGFAGRSSLSVRRSLGGMAVETARALPFTDYENVRSLWIGDLDGDGLTDIAVGTSRREGLNLFYGQRGAGFYLSGAQPYEEPTYVSGIASGDVNGDGRPDLVLSDYSADELLVLTGNGGLPLEVDERVVGLRTALGRGTMRELPQGDEDYWTFSARAGDRLLVTTENTSTAYITNPAFTIYNGGGYRIASFTTRRYGGEGQNAPLTLDAGGRIVVRVADSSTQGNEYRINVNLVPAPAQLESQNNDRWQDADAPVFERTPGQREALVFGVVDRKENNGDHFFLGNLNGGTTLQVRLALPENSLLDPRLQLYREDGTLLAETTDSALTLEATIPAGEGGAYYARIGGTEITRGFRASYAATLRTLDTAPPEIVASDLPAESSADFINAITLTLNEDFAVETVEEPSAFRLVGAGPDGSLGTADDVVVPLSIPTYSGGTQLTVPLAEEPLPPGMYEFTAFSSISDTHGNPLPQDYVETFTVDELPGFQTEILGNSDPAGATPMELESNLGGQRSLAGRGRLSDADDEDYWRFSAEAGERLVVDTDFPGSPNSSALQFVVTAPDGTTELLNFESDRGGDTATSGVVALPQTGDYELRVDRGRDAFTGIYHFRVTVLDAETEWASEPNESTAEASVLTLAASGDGQSGAVNGVIADALDRDFVSLGTLAAGNTLFLSAEPGPYGGLVPVVSVYRVAATGEDVFMSEVASGRNGDAVVEIDITEEHEYFALVRGSSATGSLQGEYRLSAELLPANLANFANLQVTSVSAPDGAGLLSGQDVSFSFTVSNVGGSDTVASSWLDRVVLSENNIPGDGDDRQLSVIERTQVLASGDSYTVNATAALPEGISGSYFLIVRTDTADQVNEYLFEGDNSLASSGTFSVSLADYPDLVVENLVIQEPDTNGSLTVSWETANRGEADVDESFSERVQVIDRITGGVAVSEEEILSVPLAVDATVARSVELRGLAPSNYRLVIETDYQNDFYEYGASGHEAAEENRAAGDFIVYRFFDIQTSSSPVDGGSTSGGGVIREGNSVTVTATPETDTAPWRFVRWKSAAGELLTTEPQYNFIPDANLDLIAEFELPLYSVSLSRAPAPAGTVSGGGGFRWGSEVAVRANPAPGWLFAHWEDLSDGSTLGTDPTLAITVTEDRSLRAVFEEENPTHDVTVATEPAGVANPIGDGTYSNGETLSLSVPATVVEQPREYIFQYWSLNGNRFSGSAEASKTFRTVDPPVMDFVAVYSDNSYLPEVETVDSLVATSDPIPGGRLFGVTLHFDRSMDTTVAPELELVSGDAATVGSLDGTGRWLDAQTWESGTVQFVSENSGNYELQVSGATGEDGRTMASVNVLSFTVDATPPALPELSVLSTGDGTATLEWNSYSAPPDLYAFRLYLSETPFSAVSPGESLVGIGQSSRQYMFTGLALDTEYHAAVVPVDAAGNAVETVSPISFTVASDVPPPVTVSLLADEPDRALLDWSSYDARNLIGFSGYAVYRSTEPFSDVSGMSPVASLAADSQQFRSDLLDRNETYYFAVVGVNQRGDFDSAVTAVEWNDPLAGEVTEDLTFGGAGQERIEILGSLTIRNGATLTIEPGTVLSFVAGAGITVEDGRIVAEGTALAPVRFTSEQDQSGEPLPASGDWSGLQLSDPNNTSVLRYVWIQYGDGLEISGADPELEHVVLLDNAGAGLHVDAGAVVSGSSLFLGHNGTGLRVTGSGSSITLVDSIFRNNAGMAAETETGGEAVLRGNFWGSTDAVEIAGQVSGTVDSSDFLSSEPILGSGIGLDQPTLQTTNGTIPVLLGAMNAASYRISEDSTFTGVSFRDLHEDGATRFFNREAFGESFSLSEGAGLKTIFVEFLNAAGDSSHVMELAVTLLDEGPVISGLNLAEGDLLQRPVTVEATASSPVGIADFRLEADGETVLQTTANTLVERWEISGLTPGVYRLRLVATDSSGNLATRLLNVTVDPQPPVAPVIESPADGSLFTENTVDITGSAEPLMDLRVTVNGTRVATGAADATGQFVFEGVGLLEGSNRVVVTASDAAGSTPSDVLEVISDTASPLALVLEEPLYDPETGLILQWRFSEAEGERAVRYKVFWNADSFTDPVEADGASDLVEVQSWAFENQPNRRYYFRVVGYDAAGNASPVSNEVTAVFDDTPPVVSIFYDQSMPVGSGELGITVESNEPLGGTPLMTIQPEGRRLPISVPLVEDGSQRWTAAFTVSDASMASGTAEVEVTARDEDANRFRGSPEGEALVVDLTRPTAVLRTNVEAPLQVLNPKQIEITLEISEPVAVGTEPTLKWSPPSGPDVAISLEGSEDIWTGTLTFFPEMGKGDGLFLFEATDAVGNDGTLITRGDSYEIYNTLLPAPPGRPVELLAESRPAGEIRLVWEPSERAETYNLYRVPSGQSGTPNQLVAEGIMGNEYFDTPPADGQYRYVVTASRLGAESDPSPAFTVTSDRTAPPPPENIRVSLGTNGVVVEYDEPSGGGETPYRYVLYRNGSPLPVSRPTAQPFRDFPPRGVMIYQVASSDVYGNHALSGEATIEMFLGPVKDVQVVVEPGEPVRLAWAQTDAVTEGFNLYRNGVRQNAAILTNAFYADPLRMEGQAVTYAITAVNDQGQESAAREIVVQPLGLSIALNPDAGGADQLSIAGTFDRYAVRAANASGSGAVDLAHFAFSRETSAGTVLERGYARSVTIGVGGEEAVEWVLPSPLDEGVPQSVSVTASTVSGPGGGVVEYIERAEFAGALSRPDMIDLVAVEPPLAGGLTDFTVEFTNLGRTPMDFVLVRDGGAEPGDLRIEVADTEGQVVSVNEITQIPGGLQFNGAGDGFLRLGSGQTRSFTFPDVFVPAALADAEQAEFEAVLDYIYTDTGGAGEDRTGPFRGSMSSNLTETPYYGTSSTARGIYRNDEEIVITGQSLDRETDQPVAESDLRIGFNVQGFTFYREVTTDADGNYSYTYTPSAGLGGEIRIWAAHPEIVDELDQTSIVLYRSFLVPGNGDIRMSKNDFLEFELELLNVGDRELSDFSLTSRAYLVDGEGNETDIDSIRGLLREDLPTTVGAQQRIPVKLRLEADLDAPDSAMLELTLTSSEGAASTFRASMDLLPAIPVLDVVSPRNGYVDLTVNRGELKSRQVTITNRGLRPLLDPVLEVPQDIAWMQINLPQNADGEVELPDLAVGDTLTFGVVYAPPEGTEVGFYDDFLLISGSNAVADFRVNLFGQVNSSEEGDVEFFVDNNLVQPIPNASIRLRNVTLGIERGPVRTDANGYVKVEGLQEGRWSWQISAPSHQSKAGTVVVNPNNTEGVDIRLGKSLVSIEFSVVPVPFTDRYEIKLEQTFETRVPAPVLVFDPPQFDFETDQPFEADVVLTLTNHGLVSVFDVEISAGTSKYLRITPLIQYLPELAAQESVEIPAKIVFSGFERTLAEAGLVASPTAVGGDIPSLCDGPVGDAEFLQGLLAITKLGAKGGYECFDGDPGLVEAIVMASASAYKAATSIPGSVADAVVSTVASLIQGCFTFDPGGDPDGGTGDGPPPHSTQPKPGFSGPGCFVAGTEVVKADGDLVAIEQLRAGDHVRSNANGGTSEIRDVYTLVAERLVRLRTETGREVVTTPEHRVWVDGAGWQAAGSLRAGDWLSTASGDFEKLASVETAGGPERVYTFQLEGDRAFYANGLLVEDLCGGRMLSREQWKQLTPLAQKEGGR